MLAQTKHIAIIDSNLLADYIVFKYGPMSHLKLQKLLFYVDALHLAYFDSQIIEDEFEAWVHGPVSRKIYQGLRDTAMMYQDLEFTMNGETDTPDIKIQQQLASEQMELVDEVLQEYSKLSGLQLEGLSHSEQPWILARKGFMPADRCNTKIDKEITKQFYKDQVYGR